MQGRGLGIAEARGLSYGVGLGERVQESSISLGGFILKIHPATLVPVTTERLGQAES